MLVFGSVLVVVVLAACASHAAAVTSATGGRFAAWAAEHGKEYRTREERLQRAQVFADNLVRIAALNKKWHGKTVFGVNKFADLTEAEFVEQWASGLRNVNVSALLVGARMAPAVSQDVIRAIPTEFSWRSKGAVTPVKNQGQCGSCWSFSATGNMEGQWALAGNQLVGLSEQNLVDCSTAQGNMGCNGGLMSDAFKYVISNNGIDSEASYPYTATGPNQCLFNASNVATKIDSWEFVQKNEAQMMAYSYQHGPLSIAVDATTWQFYITGVIYYPGCGTSLDHGVLITGWGSETDIFGQTMPYWEIKNSWGADWGKDGYLWVEYQPDGNECGVSMNPVSSIVKKKTSQ